MAEFIVGLADLEAKFRRLEVCLQASVLTEAAKAGGDILKSEAMALAPRGATGNLAAHIRLRTRRESDANEGGVEVLPGKKEFYGYFKEFGTGRFFDSSAAQAMGLPGKGRGGKRGPSLPAKPFLRPAAENKRPQIIEAVQARLVTAIEKAAR